MGDAQQLTPDEQIRSAREAYENGTDFTLAVEEEFAVLDPETLSLVNIGIRGADRAIAVAIALRNYLPELLAVSASSPIVEGVCTYLHSARTEIFTRMFPRCGVPDAYDGWQGFEDSVRFLYATGSITEHTQIWWSVRTHLAFPTVEIRICDAQPDLEESRPLAALCYGLTARLARALDEGEPLPDHPHRLIQEDFW